MKKRYKLKPRAYIIFALLALVIVFLFVSCIGRIAGGDSGNTDSTGGNGSDIVAGSPESPDDEPGGEPADNSGTETGYKYYNETTISWNKSADEYQNINRLILINKHYPAPEGYEPPDRILPANRATNREEVAQYLTREAADAFNALSADAAAQGYTIVVTTAYRDKSYQSVLYNNYVNKDGQAAADTYSARPGYSEHQTGLSTDVSSPSVNYQLTKDYINTAEGKWLNDNCHKYGFIIRFPDGAEGITGYTYEPWHIRYVGVENATQIHEAGITLEEFLGAEAAPTYL